MDRRFNVIIPDDNLMHPDVIADAHQGKTKSAHDVLPVFTGSMPFLFLLNTHAAIIARTEPPVPYQCFISIVLIFLAGTYTVPQATAS